MKLFKHVAIFGAAFALVQTGYGDEAALNQETVLQDANLVSSPEITLGEQSTEFLSEESLADESEVVNRYRDRPAPECAPVCPKPCPPKPCPKPTPRPCPKPCARPAPKPCAPEPCCPVKCPCPNPPCFEQGFPTSCYCTPAAYNQAAAIDLRCGWDFFADASFIYWVAEQDGMSVALASTANVAGVLTSPFSLNTYKSPVFEQKTQYKPGFKVGAGWTSSMDDWVLAAEYTWLHASTHISSFPPSASHGVGNTGTWNPLWIQPSPVLGLTGVGSTTPFVVAGKVSSTWKYEVDLLDAQMSRPFYSGKMLLLEPFFGMRAAWLEQKLHVQYSSPFADSGTVAASAFNTPLDSYTQSNSWGLGPRAGLNGNWHMGYGLRFIGNVNGSVLFTRYTKVRHTEDRNNSLQTNDVNYYWKKVNRLRPNMGMDLGLGWGTYFGCWKYHVDLAATYEFNVFWHQNMMRNLVDLELTYADAAPGNLYLHGLTFKVLMDF